VNKKISRRWLVANSPSGTKQQPSISSFFNFVWCGLASMTRTTSPSMRKTLSEKQTRLTNIWISPRAEMIRQAVRYVGTEHFGG
jgi:hypothetical protein